VIYALDNVDFCFIPAVAAHVALVFIEFPGINLRIFIWQLHANNLQVILFAFSSVGAGNQPVNAGFLPRAAKY
jgi:hypothetical protein